MIKFEIDGAELKSIIEKALCNMEKKTSFPALKSVVLCDDGKQLSACTSTVETDLKVTTRDYFSYGTIGKIGIDVDDLKILLNMTGTVYLEELENKIQVENGKRTINLCKTNIEQFPEIMEEPIGAYADMLKFRESDFLEVIKTLSVFTSDDNNRDVFQCINFNLTGNRIEALDGYRLTAKTLQENEKIVESGSILIHKRAVKSLRKALDKKSESNVIISQSEKYVKVSGDHFTYYQRRFVKEYINTDHLISTDYGSTFEVDRDNLLEHVKYYTENVLSKAERQPCLLFLIKDETLLSYAKNSRLEVTDTVEIKNDQGVEAVASFNPFFWEDALKAADSDTLQISGKDGGAFTIKSDKYFSLVLPYRSDTTKTYKALLEKTLASKMHN